jgi:hypothetical protein
MLLGQPSVVVTDGGNGACLHLRQPLTTGKHRRAGMRLNDAPQRLVDQIGEFAAGPFAVVDFGEAVIEDRLDAKRIGERLDRAPASQ